MKNFIKGIFFISLLLPLIEGITSIYNTFIEFICTHIAYKIYKIKEKIETNDSEEGSQITHAIGFHIPNDEEYDAEGE